MTGFDMTPWLGDLRDSLLTFLKFLHGQVPTTGTSNPLDDDDIIEQI